MIQKILERVFHIRRTSWIERHFIIMLVVGASIAMAISLAVGMSQSVWFDESYSILVARQPIEQLLSLTSVDTHPPLYYLLLKAWAGIFGWGELALRSLSVIAMGGAVIFGGLLVKRMFGVRAALITLPFIMFAPFLLRYGFEIRMYAAASLIGVAATYVLVTAVEASTNRQRLIRYGIYAVLVALGVYALYYTALLWIAHLIWLAWQTYSFKKPFIKAPWIVAFVGSVVLFLPWLPVFISQITNNALAPITQAMTLSNMVGIVSFMFVYQPAWQVGAIVSLLVLFVIVTLVYVLMKAHKLVPEKQKKYLSLLEMYALIPIIVITIASLFRPIYVERYLAHILIGASMLVGVAVWLAAQKSYKKIVLLSFDLVIVLLVGVSSLVALGNYNFQRSETPSGSEVARVLDDCTTGTIILVGAYIYIDQLYELQNCANTYVYEPENPGFNGGYAIIHDSPRRVTNFEPVAGADKTITVIYYVDDAEKIQVDRPYILRSSTSIDKAIVDVYQRES